MLLIGTVSWLQESDINPSAPDKTQFRRVKEIEISIRRE